MDGEQQQRRRRADADDEQQLQHGHQRTAKRMRLSPPTNNDDDAMDARQAAIARLLNESAKRSKSNGPSGPLVQALEEDSTSNLSNGLPQPPGWLSQPALGASSDILARVQSFLPQIQRANAAIGNDSNSGAATTGFELVNQDTAELDAEAEEDERNLRGDQEGELDPQIVMDLALGVLEEKHDSSSEEDGSDSSVDDEEESSADEGTSDEDTDDDEDHEEEGDLSNEGDEDQADDRSNGSRSNADPTAIPRGKALIQEIT